MPESTFMTLRGRKIFIAAVALLGIWELSGGLYIHAKAWLAQKLIATAWARTLAGEKDVRPWPWADTWPIARLKIEASHVDLYVLADASGRSLAFGPGLVSGTAPLGSEGASIVAAHRDTHFRFLKELRPGTMLSLQTADGRKYLYKVSEAHILDVRAERLSLDDVVPTLTLLTCYPFDAVVPGGPLRYAAVAERVEGISANAM